MSTSNKQAKPSTRGSRPSRAVVHTTEKYIKIVKEFVQNLPDGVKFTPERPEMF